MKVIYFQAANPSRGVIQKRVRLLASPDLDELSKTGPSNWHDTRRGNFSQRTLQNQSTTLLQMCTVRTSSNATLHRRKRPIIKSKDQMFSVGCGASVMVERVLNVRERNTSGNRRLPGIPRRERYRPFHRIGQGLHSGARQLTTLCLSSRSHSKPFFHHWIQYHPALTLQEETLCQNRSGGGYVSIVGILPRTDDR